jgi:hypothetical protein
MEMIKHDEVIERATKAIERTRHNPEYAATANELIHRFEGLTARDLRRFQGMILAAVAEAIRLEFTICRDWRAEEHREGRWSLRNERTGERYRVRARGLKANRLVTFKVKAQAERAAYRRNLAETPNP